jgi:hypothetical protein
MVVAVNEAWSSSEALLHFRDYDLLDVKKTMNESKPSQKFRGRRCLPSRAFPLKKCQPWIEVLALKQSLC